MNALFALQCVQNPKLRLLKYSQFVSDPTGKIAQRKLDEEMGQKRFDAYTNAIQLTEGVTMNH